MRLTPLLCPALMMLAMPPCLALSIDKVRAGATYYFFDEPSEPSQRLKVLQVDVPGKKVGVQLEDGRTGWLDSSAIDPLEHDDGLDMDHPIVFARLLAESEAEYGENPPGRIVFLNRCSKEVRLAIFYMDSDFGPFPEGWWTVAPNKVTALATVLKEGGVETKDTSLFFYAKTATSPVLEWRGAFSVTLFDKTRLLMRRVAIVQKGKDRQFSISCP